MGGLPDHELKKVIEMTRDTLYMPGPSRSSVLQCHTMEELTHLHDQALEDHLLGKGNGSQDSEVVFQDKEPKILQWLWKQRILFSNGYYRRKYLIKRYVSRIKRYLKPLPEAPIAGNSQIQAISNYRQLVSEGKEMKHCISTYYSRVMIGHYFAYRMSTPERLTIGIEIEGNTLRLDQVKAYRNGDASEESWEIVREWMKEQCRLSRQTEGLYRNEAES